MVLMVSCTVSLVLYIRSRSDTRRAVSEEMKNPSRDAPRVMIWSMVWASVTAVLSGIIMCYTVGPNWEARLDEGSPYLVWFMDVTNSVYGGGVFCCITMMGLNVRMRAVITQRIRHSNR